MWQDAARATELPPPSPPPLAAANVTAAPAKLADTFEGQFRRMPRFAQREPPRPLAFRMFSGPNGSGAAVFTGDYVMTRGTP